MLLYLTWSLNPLVSLCIIYVEGKGVWTWNTHVNKALGTTRILAKPKAILIRLLKTKLSASLHVITVAECWNRHLKELHASCVGATEAIVAKTAWTEARKAWRRNLQLWQLAFTKWPYTIQSLSEIGRYRTTWCHCEEGYKPMRQSRGKQYDRRKPCFSQRDRHGR